MNKFEHIYMWIILLPVFNISKSIITFLTVSLDHDVGRKTNTCILHNNNSMIYIFF